MVQILVLDSVDSASLLSLREENYEVIDLTNDKNSLNDYLETADGIIIRSATKATSDFLKRFNKIKIIARAGVGLDNVDLEYCKSNGIKVVNSPNGPSKSVAELTVAMLISVSRNLRSALIGTVEKKWPKKTSAGTEVSGKILGIIGTGAIGFEVAKLANCLGMKVIGYDIIINQKLKESGWFEYVDKDELLRNSDYVTIHVPLLKSTYHILSDEEFKIMKHGSFVLNMSRGGLIDEDSLIKAIESGKIKGAALDTYEKEPVQNEDILSNPQIFCTPHIGASTTEALQKNTSIIVKEIIDFFTQK